MATAAQRENAKKFKLAIAYRKAHPELSQKQAFAKVYGKRVLNEPKKKVKKKVAGTRVVKVKKQTGRSTKVNDKRIQALRPGKRVTASGSTYTETRANRSDRGRMLGTMGQVMKAGQIILLKKLGDLTAKKFIAKKKSDKNRIQREIVQVRKDLKKFIN